jgi:hypothetical protein
MRDTSSFVLAALCSLALGLSGCGSTTTTSPSCESTCMGCCSNGTCLAGNSEARCGRFGLQCSTCTAGQQCREGTCTTPTCASVAGTIFALTFGPFMKDGNCPNTSADGLQLSFFSNGATLNPLGASCTYGQQGCAVTATCDVPAGTFAFNVMLRPDGRSFTGSGRQTNSGSPGCNGYTFTVQGSR